MRGEQKGFSALIVRDARREVAHVSMLFPRDFKSDFMDDNDVVIARLYTEPGNRGLGLAKYGVQECLRSASSAGGWCWYVVSPENEASIHVAEANAFVKYGLAHERTWLGFKRLGRFVANDANTLF